MPRRRPWIGSVVKRLRCAGECQKMRRRSPTNGFLAKRLDQSNGRSGRDRAEWKIPRMQAGSLDKWPRVSRMTGCEDSPEEPPAVPPGRSLSRSANCRSRAHPPLRFETRGTAISRRSAEPRTPGLCRKRCKRASPAKATKARKSIRPERAKKFLPSPS